MPGSITDVSVSLPSLDAIIRALTLRAGYNSAVVVISASLLGLAGGAIGTLTLLRKRALIGDALAHAALPGLATAFLAASAIGANPRSLPILLGGALVSGVLAGLAVLLIRMHGRLREDAAIGVVLSVFFGAGIVLLSAIQSLRHANVAGLSHFIYGQTAAMNRSDAVLIGAIAVVAFGAAVLLFKEFRVVCFDDRFAAAIGLNVGLIDLLMLALIVAVIIIGLQAVGIILVVALLIIPAAAARFWTDRMGGMFALSAVLGALSGYFGAVASSLLPRLPAGAVIVLTSGMLFVMSMLIAPRRGVAASALRMLGLRARIACEHFLRGAYEALEADGDLRAGSAVRLDRIGAARGWSSPMRAMVGRLLQSRGLIVPVKAGGARAWALTERGLTESARLVRNHRLWEEYVTTHSSVAASHADFSADRVEHALSEDIIKELELELRRRGELPDEPVERVPASIHTIGPASKAG